MMGTLAAILLTVVILIPEVVLVAGRHLPAGVAKYHARYRMLWILILVVMISYWVVALGVGADVIGG